MPKLRDELLMRGHRATLAILLTLAKAALDLSTSSLVIGYGDTCRGYCPDASSSPITVRREPASSARRGSWHFQGLRGPSEVPELRAPALWRTARRGGANETRTGDPLLAKNVRVAA
jgi:hypothetical protein